MKKLLLAALAMATVLAMAPKASADAITGILNISGGVDVTSGPTFTFTAANVTANSTGDFAPLGNANSPSFYGAALTLNALPPGSFPYQLIGSNAYGLGF